MTKMNSYVKKYAQVCEKLGIDYEFYAPFKRGMFLTRANNTRAFIYKSSTPLNNHSARITSHNKRITVQLLKKAGIPTTEQIRIKTLQELEAFYLQENEIVVKPPNAKGGSGITILPSKDELEMAFQTAQKFSPGILVEKYIPGQNFRFLVLDNKVLSVVLRKPPFVIGDGKSSIVELIRDMNTIHATAHIPEVKLSKETARVLHKQECTFETILPAGKEILVRLTANLSKGATTEDITDIVPDAHKKIAVMAAKTLDLNFAGVDIICNDIKNSSSISFVIEVNASPGLKMHYYEEKGRKRDVAETIIKAIYNQRNSTGE